MNREELMAEKAKIESQLQKFAHKESKATETDYTTDFENVGDDRADNAFEVQEYQDKLALEQALEKRLAEINQQLAEN